jgi:hypothetical protein
MSDLQVGDLQFPSGGETDIERVVGIDQVFFSTTEMKGIITGANSTFSQISKFSFGELLRAPHSLIRHNDMPGGVFQIMWDRLLAGLPLAAYVKNQAKDGKLYWVFATVTPIPGGFLSVRTRPVFKPLWDAANALYEQVRPVELAAWDEGKRRPEVAAIGLKLLAEGLAEAGFSDYQEFMDLALPEEVQLRTSLCGPPPVNAQPGTPLGAVVGGAQALSQSLELLLRQLGDLGRLAADVKTTITRTTSVRAALDNARMRCVAAFDGKPDTPAVISATLPALGEWIRRADKSLGDSANAINVISPEISSARFDIALAQLHNEAILRFAYEVTLGETPLEFTMRYVPLLTQTIVGDVERMSASLATIRASLSTCGVLLREAMEGLHKTQQFLASWTMMASRATGFAVQSELDGMYGPQESLLRMTYELDQIIGQSLELASSIEPDQALEPLPVILHGAQEFADDETGGGYGK